MKCVEEVIEKFCQKINAELDRYGLNEEIREDIKALAMLEAAREKKETIDFLKPRKKGNDENI